MHVEDMEIRDFVALDIDYFAGVAEHENPCARVGCEGVTAITAVGVPGPDRLEGRAPTHGGARTPGVNHDHGTIMDRNYPFGKPRHHILNIRA
jgi:hypothetical protein